VINTLKENLFLSVYNEQFGELAWTTKKQRTGKKEEQRFIDHICYREGGKLYPVFLLGRLRVIAYPNTLGHSS
jgi:hypothetical protein